MNTNSNSYTMIYAAIMVIVVAFMLSFTSGVLKEKQGKNVELDKKKQILTSLKVDTKDQDIEKLYAGIVKKEIIVDMQGALKNEEGGFGIDIAKENAKNPEARELPVYVCEVDGAPKYVFSMRGTGLWGPIWGYLCMDADLNTVYGSYFSHAGETPGLGAEISTLPFQNQFVGKKILNAQGEFVSIAVVKVGKTAVGRDYVDGISGGTITSSAVDKMLKESVSQYTNYIKLNRGK